MVDEVKFDRLKRSGLANTKGDDLFLRHTRHRAPLNSSRRHHNEGRTDKKENKIMKAHQISKHGLPAEVMELVDIPKPDAAAVTRTSTLSAASRWAVGGDE